MARVKRSELAGTWYAADSSGLRQQLDRLFLAAGAAPSAPLFGLIVPHAGYVYSGRAAAAGYGRLTAGEYRRIVILAPSHLAAYRGVALTEVDAFETPLGLVPVERQGVEQLLHHDLYRSNPQPFEGEHSLEIQLPFLQCVVPGIPVVPALVGDLDGSDLAEAATALRRLDDGTTLFVVSSDFIHYGWRFGYTPFPPDGAEAVRSGLRALDMGAIDRICSGQCSAFQRYITETGATICGRVPVALFLAMYGQRSPGELFTYYTSLDVTGDYEHCVSYASIGFPRPG